MNGALKNCLVLDLSRLLPGPYCSMILADHGARVIAIEDRRFEKEAVPELHHVNRNKQHMTLNLKSERGKQIFFSLATKADVILEGFRPGVVDRLGVGYEAVNAVNPKIIYCSLTGYGQTGPLKDQAGHDVNFVGHSGALSMIGPKDAPPCIPGLPLADITGGLNAAIGILLALFAREKTGKGQYIDVSMTDSVTALMPMTAGHYWQTGTLPKRGDFMFSHRYAFYNLYQTKDGKYLTLGALEPRFWETLCNHFNVPQYIAVQFDDSRREEVIRFFQQAFLEKTRDEWFEIFSKMDVCLGKVLELDEVLSGDTVKQRDMAITLERPNQPPFKTLGIPVKLSRTPGAVNTPPPSFGEHTEQILKELGFSDVQIRELAVDGVL